MQAWPRFHREVAEQLNLDKNAVYRYLNDGVLPGLQLGRKWLISESSLVDYLKAEEKRQTQARRHFGFGAVGDSEFNRLFERFSERARRVLQSAQEEAQQRKVSYIGTEHLLLGIMTVSGGMGKAIFAACGLTAGQVQAAVDEVVSQHLETGELDGEAMITPRLKRVIELAAEEAQRLNHGYIGVEHLTIGVLMEGASVGAGVLSRLGLTVDLARDQALRLLKAPMSERKRLAEEFEGAGRAPFTEQPAASETTLKPASQDS